MYRHSLPVWRVLLPALILALFAPSHGAAAMRPLHRGDHGKRVAGLQWMLGAHRPSAYRSTVWTFTRKPNGLYGPRTAAAVRDAKIRLGFPTRAINGTAGRDFIEILEGRRARPLEYIVRAGKRTEATVPVLPADRSFCATRLIASALAEFASGVTEIPLGSNLGPRVLVYQSSTGAYGLAWCVSFVQWNLLHVGYGTVAGRTAGVFAEVRWAREHALIHALPRPGALVAFMEGLGHTGIVIKVTAHGFESVEGNASNRVSKRWHSMSDRQPLFIWLPCPRGTL